MPFLVGVTLALAVGIFATIVGLDRERSFYSTVAIVVALLYPLFAVMGGSREALLLEVLAGLVFIVVATIGFKSSLWLVVLALAGHGAFDFVHARLIDNAGVPWFWPGFCGGYDVMAAAYLAWLMRRP